MHFTAQRIGREAVKQQDLWIDPIDPTPAPTPKSCDCIAAANKIRLAKHLRLVLSLTNDRSPASRRMVVETQPLTADDERGFVRQRVRPALIANFCPFCGAPYPPVGLQEAAFQHRSP